MKIGIVDNLHLGGAKRVVYEQIVRLSENHHIFWATNTIFSEFDASKFCKETLQLDFDPIVGASFGRLSAEWKQFSQWKKQYERAYAFFETHEVEVVLAHPDRVTQSPLIIAMSEKPVVYYAQEWLRSYYEPELHPILGGNAFTRKYEVLRRRWLKGIDFQQTRTACQVVVNSRYEANNFKNAYDIQPQIVYPGVDTETFSPASSTQEKNHFLFVGTRSPVEGFDLIDKIEKLYPYKIRKIDFSNDRFVLSDAELAKEYSQAVAVLCLSQKEPFGMIPIEAMACETPVIARNEGGYKESVVDEVTGFFIPATIEAVVDSMQRLVDNTKLQQKMGKAARKHVKASFSWDDHVSKIDKLLRLQRGRKDDY